MKVKIFFVELVNHIGPPGSIKEVLEKMREKAIVDLQNKINEFIESHSIIGEPKLLQSSATNVHGSFTQMTIIVSYDKD
ncbi:MAG: hypothetical protein WCW87_00750 [Candidatus Paceibacterota bacterium]